MLNTNRTALNRSDYVPFGKRVTTYGLFHPRKSFIDREKDYENGFGSFGLRQYDEEIGRFVAIDPKWEKFPATTPYNYAENNPVLLKDPNGDNPLLLLLPAVAEGVVIAAAAVTAVVATVKISELESTIPSLPTRPFAQLPGFIPPPIFLNPTATKDHSYIGRGTPGKLSTEVDSKPMTQAKAEPKMISFIQGTGENAKKVEVALPTGFNKTNEISHGQKVYTNGKVYISPDADGHNGGVWKMVETVEGLTSDSRMGTFNEQLERIGN